MTDKDLSKNIEELFEKARECDRNLAREAIKLIGMEFTVKTGNGYCNGKIITYSEREKCYYVHYEGESEFEYLHVYDALDYI